MLKSLSRPAQPYVLWLMPTSSAFPWTLFGFLCSTQAGLLSVSHRCYITPNHRAFAHAVCRTEYIFPSFYMVNFHCCFLSDTSPFSQTTRLFSCTCSQGTWPLFPRTLHGLYTFFFICVCHYLTNNNNKNSFHFSYAIIYIFGELVGHHGLSRIDHLSPDSVYWVCGNKIMCFSSGNY